MFQANKSRQDLWINRLTGATVLVMVTFVPATALWSIASFMTQMPS